MPAIAFHAEPKLNYRRAVRLEPDLVVKIADPLLMREINKYHVLETIRCHGEISRVEISERTELSGTTVSAITGALIEEGLIEARHTEPTAEAQRGRPRVLLGLVRTAAYVLGIKISEAMTTVTIVDFRGDVIAAVQLPIRLARQPIEVIVDLIEDGIDDCIRKAGVDRSKIRGIGIGVPGIVDPRSGRSYASSVFGEREVPIGALLQERTGLPVKLEKPANLLALAESWFGYAQRDATFGVVLLDQTASLGLWIEDDIHRGSSTLGPALGHIKVGSEGIACECGQTDCLNAHVGQAAIRRQMQHILGGDIVASPAGQADLLGLLADIAASGDARAQDLIDGHANKLGLAVSHIINLINPGKIIIAVESPRYAWAIAAPLRAVAEVNSFRPHFAATELIFHSLDDQLWARGAAALMLRDVYSAPWTTTY